MTETSRDNDNLSRSDGPRQLRPPLKGRVSLSRSVAATSQPDEAADKIDDLAARVSRLSPSHNDPERFHVEKSEIVHDLRRLAGRTAR